MGTVGDALDIAVGESFFASMQRELQRHKWGHLRRARPSHVQLRRNVSTTRPATSRARLPQPVNYERNCAASGLINPNHLVRNPAASSIRRQVRLIGAALRIEPKVLTDPRTFCASASLVCSILWP